MKKNILFMGLILSFLASPVFAKGKTSSKKGTKAKAVSKQALYPRLDLVLGKVYLVSESLTVENRAAKVEERERLVKKGETLKDKAHLRVDEKSEVEIQLSEDSRLTLMENTEIEIPGISWENGAIFQIRLLSGTLRATCSKECLRTFSNPLFESILPAGDFVLSYNPKAPSVQLQVLSGQAPFRGLGNEIELTLKAEEMATFKGVFEGEEPAFDVLLKGRKVAKGQATEIQKIPTDEVVRWKNRDEVVRKKAKKVAEASVVKRKKSQICDQPFGELGQCSWKCEHNPKNSKDCALQKGAVCVRSRCDANGSWADKAEMASSQSRCLKTVVVGACDY